MRFIILLLFFGLILTGSKAFGQDESLPCGTGDPHFLWEAAFQKLIQKWHAEAGENKKNSNQYVIPVVFHIIHGGEAIGTYPNLQQSQIQSQLTILNQDFSGNSYNATDYPASAFVNWAASQNIPSANLDANGRIKIADFNIQFCPATRDTNGNPMSEPGIDRINYMAKGWPAPSQFTTQATMKSYLDNVVKPQSVWNVTRYLNIWISDKSTALTYAGVSSAPPLSGLPDLPNSASATTDGIWCFSKAVGSFALFPSGTYISQFIDGRTLTHEAGHYLGLRHIWGDAACGNDFCADTPPAADQNTGTPSYPHNAGSCTTPSVNTDGEMFMNFMDYTRGPSKYMFTTDQRTRAQTAMLNSPFRNQLGTHNLCDVVSAIRKVDSEEYIRLFPNPAAGILRVSVGIQTIRAVKIINQTGQIVAESADSEVYVDKLPTGIYLVIAQTGKGRFSMKFSKQ